MRGAETGRSAADRKLKTGRNTPSLGPDSGEPNAAVRVGLTPNKQMSSDTVCKLQMQILVSHEPST